MERPSHRAKLYSQHVGQDVGRKGPTPPMWSLINDINCGIAPWENGDHGLTLVGSPGDLWDSLKSLGAKFRLAYLQDGHFLETDSRSEVHGREQGNRPQRGPHSVPRNLSQSVLCERSCLTSMSYSCDKYATKQRKGGRVSMRHNSRLQCILVVESPLATPQLQSGAESTASTQASWCSLVSRLST